MDRAKDWHNLETALWRDENRPLRQNKLNLVMEFHPANTAFYENATEIYV